MAVPPDQAYATYKDLVVRAKSGDLLVDFRAMRFACIRSGHCDPHGKTNDLSAMNQASREHNLDQVVVAAERLLEQGYTNMEAHAVLAAVYKDLGKPDLAKFHLDVTTALSRSVLDYGDGKTKETAFEAVIPREEWWILALVGLPYTGDGVSSEPINDPPHHYQRWQVPDPKTGKPTTIFFNTDAFTPANSTVIVVPRK